MSATVQVLEGLGNNSASFSKSMFDELFNVLLTLMFFLLNIYKSFLTDFKPNMKLKKVQKYIRMWEIISQSF